MTVPVNPAYASFAKRSQNAIGYPKFYSLSHRGVIRVYDAVGKVIENARARGRVKGRRDDTVRGDSSEASDDRYEFSGQRAIDLYFGFKAQRQHRF